MPVITVAQRKGGVGKTTIAISLAAELSYRESHVALIDSDPQRSSCAWAEPGNLTFPVHAIALHADRIGPWAGALKKIEKRWKIVDTAPTEHAVAASIAVADLILVPCTPSGLDIDSTDQTLSIIRAVRQRRRTPVRVILVPNRVDPRTLEGRQLIEELREFNEVVSDPIRSSSSFVRAFASGHSVVDFAGGTSATRDVATLCDLVQKALAPTAPRHR